MGSIASTHVPPSILGLAVKNLKLEGVLPAPEGDTAASTNQQTITIMYLK